MRLKVIYDKRAYKHLTVEQAAANFSHFINEVHRIEA